MKQFPLFKQWQAIVKKNPSLAKFKWHWDFNADSFYLTGPTKLQGAYATEEAAESEGYAPGFGLASEDGNTIYCNGVTLEGFVQTLLRELSQES